MDTALILLVYTLIVLCIILAIAGVFLIKLINDLTKLATNLDESVTIIKNEIEPTAKELHATLKHINTITATADKQVDNIKNIINKALGLGSTMFGRVKTLSEGFKKGLSAGIKLFCK